MGFNIEEEQFKNVLKRQLGKGVIASSSFIVAYSTAAKSLTGGQCRYLCSENIFELKYTLACRRNLSWQEEGRRQSAEESPVHP